MGTAGTLLWLPLMWVLMPLAEEPVVDADAVL